MMESVALFRFETRLLARLYCCAQMHPEVLKERIDQIDELFQTLDQAIVRFLKTANFGCKPGCGACCTKPDAVWTTVGELLPLAWKIYRAGQHELFLAKLDEFSDDAMCVLFAPTDAAKGMGRCSQYYDRPTICRLFGSSIRLSKNGLIEILACTWQREYYSQEISSAENLIHDLPDSSSMLANDWVWKVKSLLPESYLIEEFPINRAFREALQIVIQTFAYAHDDLVPTLEQTTLALALDSRVLELTVPQY